MEPTTQALLDSCKELLAIIVSRHGSLYSEAQGRAEGAISAAEGPRGMLVYQTIPVRERSEMRLTDTPPETKWLHDAS